MDRKASFNAVPVRKDKRELTANPYPSSPHHHFSHGTVASISLSSPFQKKSLNDHSFIVLSSTSTTVSNTRNTTCSSSSSSSNTTSGTYSAESDSWSSSLTTTPTTSTATTSNCSTHSSTSSTVDTNTSNNTRRSASKSSTITASDHFLQSDGDERRLPGTSPSQRLPQSQEKIHADRKGAMQAHHPCTSAPRRRKKTSEDHAFGSTPPPTGGEWRKETETPCQNVVDGSSSPRKHDEQNGGQLAPSYLVNGSRENAVEANTSLPRASHTAFGTETSPCSFASISGSAMRGEDGRPSSDGTLFSAVRLPFPTLRRPGEMERMTAMAGSHVFLKQTSRYMSRSAWTVLSPDSYSTCTIASSPSMFREHVAVPTGVGISPTAFAPTLPSLKPVTPSLSSAAPYYFSSSSSTDPPTHEAHSLPCDPSPSLFGTIPSGGIPAVSTPPSFQDPPSSFIPTSSGTSDAQSYTTTSPSFKVSIPSFSSSPTLSPFHRFRMWACEHVPSRVYEYADSLPLPLTLLTASLLTPSLFREESEAKLRQYFTAFPVRPLQHLLTSVLWTWSALLKRRKKQRSIYSIPRMRTEGSLPSRHGGRGRGAPSPAMGEAGSAGNSSAIALSPPPAWHTNTDKEEEEEAASCTGKGTTISHASPASPSMSPVRGGEGALEKDDLIASHRPRWSIPIMPRSSPSSPLAVRSSTCVISLSSSSSSSFSDRVAHPRSFSFPPSGEDQREKSTTAFPPRAPTEDFPKAHSFSFALPSESSLSSPLLLHSPVSASSNFAPHPSSTAFPPPPPPSSSWSWGGEKTTLDGCAAAPLAWVGRRAATELVVGSSVVSQGSRMVPPPTPTVTKRSGRTGVACGTDEEGTTWRTPSFSTTSLVGKVNASLHGRREGKKEQKTTATRVRRGGESGEDEGKDETPAEGIRVGEACISLLDAYDGTNPMHVQWLEALWYCHHLVWYDGVPAIPTTTEAVRDATPHGNDPSTFPSSSFLPERHADDGPRPPSHHDLLPIPPPKGKDETMDPSSTTAAGRVRPLCGPRASWSALLRVPDAATEASTSMPPHTHPVPPAPSSTTRVQNDAPSLRRHDPSMASPLSRGARHPSWRTGKEKEKENSHRKGMPSRRHTTTACMPHNDGEGKKSATVPSTKVEWKRVQAEGEERERDHSTPEGILAVSFCTPSAVACVKEKRWKASHTRSATATTFSSPLWGGAGSGRSVSRSISHERSARASPRTDALPSLFAVEHAAALSPVCAPASGFSSPPLFSSSLENSSSPSLEDPSSRLEGLSPSLLLSFPPLPVPPFQWTHPEWCSPIGFQQEDPSTDFRGGGVLGLVVLLLYIIRYPQQWRLDVQEEKNSGYFPAATSINITYFLSAQLGLRHAPHFFTPSKRYHIPSSSLDMGREHRHHRSPSRKTSSACREQTGKSRSRCRSSSSSVKEENRIHGGRQEEQVTPKRTKKKKKQKRKENVEKKHANIIRSRMARYRLLEYTLFGNPASPEVDQKKSRKAKTRKKKAAREVTHEVSRTLHHHEAVKHTKDITHSSLLEQEEKKSNKKRQTKRKSLQQKEIKKSVETSSTTGVLSKKKKKKEHESLALSSSSSSSFSPSFVAPSVSRSPSCSTTDGLAEMEKGGPTEKACMTSKEEEEKRTSPYLAENKEKECNEPQARGGMAAQEVNSSSASYSSSCFPLFSSENGDDLLVPLTYEKDGNHNSGNKENGNREEEEEELCGSHSLLFSSHATDGSPLDRLVLLHTVYMRRARVAWQTSSEKNLMEFNTILTRVYDEMDSWWLHFGGNAKTSCTTS